MIILLLLDFRSSCGDYESFIVMRQNLFTPFFVIRHQKQLPPLHVMWNDLLLSYEWLGPTCLFKCTFVIVSFSAWSRASQNWEAGYFWHILYQCSFTLPNQGELWAFIISVTTSHDLQIPWPLGQRGLLQVQVMLTVIYKNSNYTDNKNTGRFFMTSGVWSFIFSDHQQHFRPALA